jgi:hypothetical protein
MELMQLLTQVQVVAARKVRRLITLQAATAAQDLLD